MVSGNSRKSLLVINQYYHPDLASTGQLLTELCEGLTDHFNVTALVGSPSYSANAKNSPQNADRESKVNVTRVFNTKFVRSNLVGRLLNYVSFMIFATLKGVFLEKHDLVLVMSDPPTVNFIGYIIKKVKGSKLVQICQDVYPEVAQILGKADNPLMIKAFSSMNRIAQSSSDGLIAISSGMKQRLIQKKLIKEKITVIENWIDTNLVTPESKTNQFSRSKNISDKFVVMHSGNIGLSQELDVFIDTAELLKDEKSIAFVIIGDGALKKQLVERSTNKNLKNLVFLPYADKKELKYSLSAADVHFISLKKGLKGLIIPSKIYGIMAVAKPVITCMEEGDDILKLVEDHNFGYKAERDPKSVAKGVLYFYNNQHLIQEYGQRARRSVSKSNSKDIIIGLYKDYLIKMTS